MVEIVVGCQHRQVVSHAKLRQQSINCCDLYPGAPATISQVGSLDVIIAIGDKQRYCGKPVEYVRAGSRTGKTLQDLLENETRGNNRVTCFNRAYQRLHFAHRGRCLAA